MASSINASTTAGVVTTADTSGVLNIQTAGVTAISIDASQAVSFTNSANLPNTFGFKNRIINGAMVIDQRNAGASVTITAGSQYTVDRWNFDVNQLSKISAQQSTNAPAGFSNSLLVTSLAATTVGASDYFQLNHKIEGFNTSDLAFGSASASTVTLSFWVKSTLTGSFSGALKNSASNRSYPFSYSINSANTWEQKTITASGDTSGTWVGGTNGIGLVVNFSLGMGSSYTSTANSWQASNLGGVNSSVNLVSTNAATWQITGVQLEKGSTATSFDYRPYGTELALCQRYFYKTFAQGVAPANGLALSTESTVAMYDTTNGQAMYYTYSATMRTTPTITLYRSLSRGVTDGQWAVYNGSVWTSATTTTTGVSSVGFTPVVTTGVLTQFAAYLVSGHYTSSAEL